MKRLIVCCDGTWQDLETEYPTNVVRTAQAIPSMEMAGEPYPAPASGGGSRSTRSTKKRSTTTRSSSSGRGPGEGVVHQVVYYDPGVGTERGNKFGGGAFGEGLDLNIREAYRFLSLNYSPGDEVYLFGFSRGAYTVRSLAGLIRASSLVKRQHMRKIPAAFELYRDREIGPDDREAKTFRKMFGQDEQVMISALCCWDTVGSLGIPDQNRFLPVDEWFNRKHQFHDTAVSWIVEHAFHAIAIDEHRKVFGVTEMRRSGKNKDPYDRIHQCWFVDDHGCVGGGTRDKAKLSDIALDWMMRKMEEAKLPLVFDRTAIPHGLITDPLHPFESEVGWIGRLTGADLVRTIRTDGGAGKLHRTVKERWTKSGRRRGKNRPELYEPKNLEDYRDWLNDSGDDLDPEVFDSC